MSELISNHTPAQSTFQLTGQYFVPKDSILPPTIRHWYMFSQYLYVSFLPTFIVAFLIYLLAAPVISNLHDGRECICAYYYIPTLSTPPILAQCLAHSRHFIKSCWKEYYEVVLIMEMFQPLRVKQPQIIKWKLRKLKAELFCFWLKKYKKDFTVIWV